MTNTNTAAARVATDSDDALMAREAHESQDDSLLLCASDLQHSAIYDNHIEMQSCIRAVADRITALASVIEGVERAVLAAPAQPVAVPGVEAVSEREFKQFLSDVLTAAGLVTHGKKCKDLGRRLGEMSMRLLTAPKTAAAPAQAGEYPAGTGNPEADRIICRLASSDPDFDDCADAVALIHKLVAEIKGPEGFSAWKDAAVYERGLRATLEATINTASPLAYLYTDGKHPGLDFEHAPAEDLRPGFVCIPLAAAHRAARGAAQAEGGEKP